MSLKSEKNKILLGIRDNYRKYSSTNSKYHFDNRLHGKEKYLIILSGYKPYLYQYVFGRLKKYLPQDIDVCLITSGKLDESIARLAKDNDWSYLSTEKNKIAIAQNLAIKLNPSARFIYKMDEDIFTTEGCFENLYSTYSEVKKNGDSDVGFVAPIMPLNGFGYLKVLDKYKLGETYNQLFEKPLLSSDSKTKLLTDPEVAKFFWGKGNYLPSIDQMNQDFRSQPLKYSLCPIRYSIGFIMFERSLWEGMKMFRVPLGAGMGIDEEQICAFCMNSSKPIVISENSVVGHFSFGPQTKGMIDYLKSEDMDYYRNIQ